MTQLPMKLSRNVETNIPDRYIVPNCDSYQLILYTSETFPVAVLSENLSQFLFIGISPHLMPLLQLQILWNGVGLLHHISELLISFFL